MNDMMMSEFVIAVYHLKIVKSKVVDIVMYHLVENNLRNNYNCSRLQPIIVSPSGCSIYSFSGRKIWPEC